MEYDALDGPFTFWQSIPLIVIGDTNFFEALIQLSQLLRKMFHCFEVLGTPHWSAGQNCVNATQTCKEKLLVQIIANVLLKVLNVKCN